MDVNTCKAIEPSPCRSKLSFSFILQHILHMCFLPLNSTVLYFCSSTFSVHFFFFACNTNYLSNVFQILGHKKTCWCLVKEACSTDIITHVAQFMAFIDGYECRRQRLHSSNRQSNWKLTFQMEKTSMKRVGILKWLSWIFKELYKVRKTNFKNPSVYLLN